MKFQEECLNCLLIKANKTFSCTFEKYIHKSQWFSDLSMGFPGGSDGKESACKAGDPGSIPEGENPLEKGMATYLLQYSCLENPMDREAWRATVHRVAKSQTRLK